tara:strand:- start:579 stop:986 length:408 start_codon:yes stop_codon:yes gene_type:complete
MIKLKRLKTLKLLKVKVLNKVSKEINTLNGEIEKSNVLKDKLEAIKNNTKPNDKFYNAWNMNHKYNFDIKIIQQLSICKNRVAFLEKELNRSKNKLGTLILQKKHIERKIEAIIIQEKNIADIKIERNTPTFKNS